MDKVVKDKLVLPCLRGIQGDWVYYLALMTAKQIYEWIEPVKNIRESEVLHDVLQRDLKRMRKDSISKYLLNVKSHFFNSIIVGVFDGTPDWIELSLSDKIGTEVGVGIKSDIEESIGIMHFKGKEQMFAVDGQHRVEGIKKAFEEKNEEEDGLEDDQFSILFVGHIDDELGKKRTRKLFSDINKNAKPVAEGDQLKIDEENLNAIVTRRIYANYEHFNNGKLISLTETAKLYKDDTNNFTNLLGLNSVNKKLKPLFIKKRGSNEWDEENVLAFLEIVESFYDFVINNVDEYKNYFIDKTLTIKEARDENKYLLFRPIGLTLLARLYTFFKRNNKLDSFTENINKIDFIFPSSQFNKVVWNNGKMEAKTKNQSLAYDLSLYLLNAYEKDEIELLNRYQEMLKDDTTTLPDKVVN